MSGAGGKPSPLTFLGLGRRDKHRTRRETPRGSSRRSPARGPRRQAACARTHRAAPSEALALPSVPLLLRRPAPPPSSEPLNWISTGRGGSERARRAEAAPRGGPPRSRLQAARPGVERLGSRGGELTNLSSNCHSRSPAGEGPGETDGDRKGRRGESEG